MPGGGQGGSPGPHLRGAAASGARPTMLGVGPTGDSEVLGGGPTTVGGPGGLLSDYAEPPSGVSPSSMETQVNGPHGQMLIAHSTHSQQDGSLEEETHLPPPAPGLLLPTGAFTDPPTLPGLVEPRRPSRDEQGADASGEAPRQEKADNARDRLRGLAPVRRHPDGDLFTAAPRDQSTAAPAALRDLSTAALRDQDATPQRRSPDGEGLQVVDRELTSPMSIATPFHHEPLSSSKLSGGQIPALPPPPGSAEEPSLSTELRSGMSLSPEGAVPQPALALSRSAAIALQPLSAIPVAPGNPGALSAVAYLLPVARGLLERRREQGRIRRLLQTEQQSLDGVLLQLGRAAHEERLDMPHLMDEASLLRLAQERRDRAVSQIAQLSGRRQTEEQRAAAAAAEQRRLIDRLTAEAAQIDGELRQRAGHRRHHQAEISRIDALLRRLTRAAEQADARAAARAADSHAASQARAQGDSARGQAEALYPQREAAQREVAQVEGPIVELTEKLGAVRSELGLRRQELLRREQDQARLMLALDADLRLAHAERESAEREMQQRMMTVGTLVNLNRTEGPRYAPHYQQVDEIKARLSAYESALARLDTESDSIDRQAVQRGLITLGAGGLALGLCLAVLYIIWGLSHH